MPIRIRFLLLLPALAGGFIATSAGADFQKPVAHDAAFYPATERLIRPGDMMRATVIRNSGTVPITTNDPKWISRMNWLNAVKNPSVHKALTFAAVEDVKNLLQYVPRDVDYIEYNMEGGGRPQGMTPAIDYQRGVPESVRMISEMVRKSGRKFTFGPILAVWKSELPDQGKFDEVAGYCDAVAVQMQKQYDSLDGLRTAAHGLYTKFKAANRSVEVQMQLWIGRQTVEQMVQGFQAIQQDLDRAVVGTHSNPDSVVKVIETLRK